MDDRPVVMSGFAAPSDGPDAILLRLMRRFRIPASAASIARAVNAHPRPTSLLALVEVARTFGLEIKPYRADPGSLADLEPPVVAHFGDEASDGGFGVVQEIAEGGLKVWDSVNGSRVVPPDAFYAKWSRIVAVVDRDASKAPSFVRYLRGRFADLLWGAFARPSVLSGSAAPMLRLALGVLVGALLALAVAMRPVSDRPAVLGLTLLTILGLVVSARLVPASDGTPAASRLCPRGRLFDCAGVLTSRYARIAGVPFGHIGVAFYGGLLALITAGSLPGAGAVVWPVVGTAYAASLAVSLLLVGVQVSMRRLCGLCMAVHAVNLGAAAVAWTSTGISWPTPEQVPAVLVFGAFFGLLLFAIVPAVRASGALDALGARYGRIAGSPYAGLAEVLTASPTAVRGEDCGVLFGGSGAPHELVLFVHPSCSACGPMLREVSTLVGTGHVAVFAAVAPRTDVERDRRLCEGIVAAGVRFGPQAMVGAYEAAKADLDRALREEPTRMLADALSVEPSELAAGLDEAERLVGPAWELAERYVPGTPTVFFDSRRYEGWVSHLAVLLTHHPELLAPIEIPQPRDETAPA